MTFKSAEYWEGRYQAGGYSGAGSVGRLADFKAAVLNRFVSEHGVRDVIEFGCGDGAQLSLAKYPRYVGIDVSATAIANCQARFYHDTSKRFFLPADLPTPRDFDLALSLDVIYHLIEDAVFAHYMTLLFAASTRYVIIYSSNINLIRAAHVHDREFVSWIESHQPHWRLFLHIPNMYPWNAADPHNTSSSDFFVYERRHERRELK